eukprot:3724482-Prorocentrum_lima.AAC.1
MEVETSLRDKIQQDMCGNSSSETDADMESLPPEEPESDLVVGTGVLSEDPSSVSLNMAPLPSVPEVSASG